MKKKIALVSVFIFSFLTGFSQIIKKQIHIPMDNVSGIPYTLTEGQMSTLGFEIDKAGNYFFLSVKNNANTIKSVLAKYKSNSFEFKKVYTDYIGSKLYIYNEKIYVFNPLRKDLSILKTDGAIVEKYSAITPTAINSYRLLDSSLIVDILGKPDLSNLSHELYSLQGVRIKTIANANNLPDKIFKKIKIDDIYLGKWNGGYLFWNYEDRFPVHNYKFWKISENGVIEKVKYLQCKLLGDVSEDMSEFCKLRGSTIYFFGHNGKDGIITQISPEEMFK